ncbi:hypothetical protein [Enterobacter asburiae]|uniref:hypothetical protein n=1 Tax=Enterobacter asburiae TaxID=61645 RepID=UPI001F405F2A|nr:hypothetical protein [Enterobacter asburiae]
MTNNQLADKRARLRKVAQDYQSTLSWYQDNLDSPNAEQDCDEATAAFKREIGYREMDIIADLLDELDELQELRKPSINSEPIVPEIVPGTLRDEIIDLCAGYEIGDQGAQEIWEACRAVMLSGGKP